MNELHVIRIELKTKELTADQFSFPGSLWLLNVEDPMENMNALLPL